MLTSQNSALVCLATSVENQSTLTHQTGWPLQRLIVLSFFWCLTAESPADCVREAEESDVLLSHRRAALAGNASQPLHRAAHRGAADRVRDIRPQLHHPVLQEQRQGAQGEDTHALNICREARNLDIYSQTDTKCSKYILSSLHITCFVTAIFFPPPSVLFSHTLHSLILFLPFLPLSHACCL